MGYNATVVVLLDRLQEIENDPDFGKKLCAAIRYKSCYGDSEGPQIFGDEATGQTKVIETHHADYQMVITVGGNTGRVLGYGGSYKDTPDEVIKNLNKWSRVRKKKA